MAERELLLSRGIELRPRLTLIDFDGNLIEDVTGRFVAQGSYIRRDSTAKVDGSATFYFTDVEEFDFGRHLLAVEVQMVDLFRREDPIRYRMGNWVMQPPSVKLDSRELVAVNCVDTVSLLATRLEAVYSITPGTNVVSAIVALLRRHGIVGLSGLYNERGLPLTIGWELATYGNWNITDEITYLDIINQLLEISAHVGLYTDRLGRLTSYPWTPLRQLPTRWDFDYTRDDGSFITPQTTKLPITEQIPNIWIGVAVAVDQPGDAEIRRLELRAGSNSPFSVEAQGGRRNVRVLNLKVGSVEELERAVAQIQEEDVTRSERVEITLRASPSFVASRSCQGSYS